jgi:hypothetical protein
MVSTGEKMKIGLRFGIKGLVLSLIASFLVFVPISNGYAHGAIDAANISANVGTLNGSLFVATKIGTSAVSHSGLSTSSGHADARSVGLFLKDTTSGTAQTATVVTGGVLSLYAMVSTTTAISATSGTVATATAHATNSGLTSTFSSGATASAFTGATSSAATTVAVLYTAPSSAGSVTISLYVMNGSSAATPSSTNPKLGTKAGEITVTVISSDNLSTTHLSAGSSTNNLAVSSGTVGSSMITATASNTGGSAVTADVSQSINSYTLSSSARSVGLLAKDSTMGTAQTATVLTGGVLSLYAPVTTTVAFTSSGGTFSTTVSGEGTITYSDPAKTTLVVLTSSQADSALAAGATAVATRWTAPSSAGTYTVSLYKHSGAVAPTTTTPSGGTLAANITVTVVAASAGGSYSAANSACLTKTSATTEVYDGISGTLTADSTSSNVANGSAWYIGFKLNDAYGANLSAGNIVVNATNNGVVNLGDGTSAVTAGTGSTVVEASTGASRQVRVDQPTSGAPLTTTVTISYNGTTVCTKTVSIRGLAASVSVSDIATVDLGGAVVNNDWLGETDTVPASLGTARHGHYYVTLKDSAGNIVFPASGDSFSMDPSTTTSIVTALTVASGNFATTTSSTNPMSKSVGTFTCGPTAGQSDVKLRFTTAATGVTITSPAFTARCADDPVSYKVSLDKASYTQGEIATMTVSFFDSKGNPANSVDSPGSVTMVMPYMTFVTATGSANMLPNNKGVKTYTMTVGTNVASVAGTYTGVVDFSTITSTYGVDKATPTYKISTGGDTTTNAEVLKSIVALIASINKQIQALQKLILKR